MVRLEQHDGRRWTFVQLFYCLDAANIAFEFLRHEYPGLGVRTVGAECRRTIRLADPRRNYEYRAVTNRLDVAP